MSLIERKISIADSKETYNINYVSNGTGKKGLILLPGALGSVETDFQQQIENLPKLLDEYQVIAWDPPGYGKSRPPERTYPVDFFHRDASVAHQLMQSIGIDKYSVAGWSDGGITGLLMAAKYPEAVEKLIVWGSNAFVLPEEIEMYESIRDVSKWSPKMREPMEKVYGPEYFAKLWSMWVDGFSQLHKMNGGDICKSELNKIKCKTFILHGLKDPMIDKSHVPYLLKSIKSTRYFEFPEGKHNIHLRYADEFNNLVSEFLKN